MLYLLFNQNFSGLEILAMLLAFTLAISVAMTFHEWAHAKSAFSCGDSTAKLSGRLTLNPLAHVSWFGLLGFLLVGFGWAKPVPVNPANFRSYKKNATWVYASGVLTNFILAFIFTGIFYFVSGLLIDSATGYFYNTLCFFIYYFLYAGITINIALCLFNLLPIPPLDGYNILAVWTKYNNKFIQFLNRYGMLILLILIIPFINGNSILSWFYNYFGDVIIRFFGFFWGLFV